MAHAGNAETKNLAAPPRIVVDMPKAPQAPLTVSATAAAPAATGHQNGVTLASASLRGGLAPQAAAPPSPRKPHIFRGGSLREPSIGSGLDGRGDTTTTTNNNSNSNNNNPTTLRQSQIPTSAVSSSNYGQTSSEIHSGPVGHHYTNLYKSLAKHGEGRDPAAAAALG